MELMNSNVKEETKPFDYSQLKAEVSEYLQEKVYRMQNLSGGFYTEIGKELKEAQDTLSLHGYGCFEEWYTSLNLSKVSVYKWINRYNLIVHNVNEQKFIEQMQLSLSYEISKPKAPKDLVEKVFNGEITTQKEYVEIIKASKPKKEKVKKPEPEETNPDNPVDNNSKGEEIAPLQKDIHVEEDIQDNEGLTMLSKVDEEEEKENIDNEPEPEDNFESKQSVHYAHIDYDIGADADELRTSSRDNLVLIKDIDAAIQEEINIDETILPEIILSPFEENIAITNDIDNKLDDAEPLIESDSFTQAELDEMYNQYHKLEKRLLNIKRKLKNRIPIDKKKNKPGQGRPPKSPNKNKVDVNDTNTQEVTAI